MRSGFTLLELSIVLVIIGLIIGGILTGTTLMEAAQLRAINRQYNEFLTASQTFRSKYNCLPGDCLNATDFFGTSSDCAPNKMDNPMEVPTCNGDGNGFIDVSSAGASLEAFTYWQHLGNANLVNGKFRGSLLSTGNNIDPTVIMPVINYFAQGWYLERNIANNYIMQAGTGPAFSHHFIVYPYDLNFTGNSIFLPREAFAYDTKYDDGRPARGAIQTLNSGWIPNCTTNQTIDAQYDTSRTTRICSFMYLFNF